MYIFKYNLNNFKKRIKTFIIKERTNIIFFLIIKSKIFKRFYYKRLINIHNPNLQNFDPNKKNLIMIWEERFKYLKYKLYKDKKVNLIIIPRIFFTPGFNFFLGKYVKQQLEISLGEYNLDYYRSNQFLKNRKNFRNYCHTINNLIKSVVNIDMILMPKCNDDWTIDYIKVINESNIKLIIDDREGTITNQRLKTVPEKLRNLDLKFDLMTTHNSFHKALFVESGFASSKIKVNGATQSDYWSKPTFWKDLNEIDQNLNESLLKILFFSFGKRTYMNFYYGEEKRTWLPLIQDVNDVLIDILDQFYGKIQILYKFSGKLKRDTSEDVSRLIKKSQKHIKNKNLVFLDGSKSSFDLIRHCQAVLGFQTSGMIEAMNTNKPIIYSAWGDLYGDIKDTLLPLEDSNCLTVCKSKDELYYSLCNLINNYDDITIKNNQEVSRAEFIEKYFTNSDGLVSDRLADIIYEKI